MPFEFIQVPANGQGSAKEELNKLLRNGRIASVKKEFVSNGEDSFWAFCIEFLDGVLGTDKVRSGSGPKVDYKEVLSAEDFSVFSKLRDLRKALSDKEAIPAYSIFRFQQRGLPPRPQLRPTMPDGTMSMGLNRPPSRSRRVMRRDKNTSRPPGAGRPGGRRAEGPGRVVAPVASVYDRRWISVLHVSSP